MVGALRRAGIGDSHTRLAPRSEGGEFTDANLERRCPGSLELHSLLCGDKLRQSFNPQFDVAADCAVRRVTSCIFHCSAPQLENTETSRMVRGQSSGCWMPPRLGVWPYWFDISHTSILKMAPQAPKRQSTATVAGVTHQRRPRMCKTCHAQKWHC